MRKNIKRYTLIAITVILYNLPNFLQVNAADSMDVILQWAPFIDQQNYATNPIERINVFTKVNFDQDWRTNNNFMNLSFNPVDPAVYYSLVESDTHYFIGYYLYYPRYKGDEEHENDMIGVLIALRKPGLSSESVEMVLSYSNGKWRRWQNGKELKRPIVSIRSGVHEITNVSTSGRPSTKMVYPNWIKIKEGKYYYCLLNLSELWRYRNDIGKGHVFDRWGYFDGYYYKNTSAPWIWMYNDFKWLSNPGELMNNVLHLKNAQTIYKDNEYR